MKQYLDLVRHVMANGVEKSDRTGTGTRSVFGYQMRFNLAEGFPLVTTKKTHERSIIHELLWFLMGDTNVKYLQDHGVKIWDEWAPTEDVVRNYTLSNYLRVAEAVNQSLWQGTIEELQTKLNTMSDEAGHVYLDELGVPRGGSITTRRKGDLGPVYGAQWRSWPTPEGGYIDQMVRVVNDLKNTPDSRRIIVSAWNVGELDKMALAPCHAFFQFYVANGKLSCQLYQRSCDVFLGLPFNIASYALLTHMLAQQCDLEVGEFIWTGGDVHIYSNHFEQVETLLQREPRALPQLRFKRRPESLFDYQYDDFVITGYDPHPPIKAPVAV